MTTKRELLDFAIQHHNRGLCRGNEPADVVATAKAFDEFINGSQAARPLDAPEVATRLTSCPACGVAHRAP